MPLIIIIYDFIGYKSQVNIFWLNGRRNGETYKESGPKVVNINIFIRYSHVLNDVHTGIVEIMVPISNPNKISLTTGLFFL